MGLFGLFATAFGLGAMAKDAISNGISNSKNYNSAKIDNNPYYFSDGGKIKSTQTCEYARRRKDEITGDMWLVDEKTGDKITNLTDLCRKRRNDMAIADAIKNQKTFYRIHDYDIYNGDVVVQQANIYKCLTIPGYFKRLGDKYVRGELGYDKSYARTKSSDNKFVDIQFRCVIITENSEEYYEDGTLYTEDEAERRDLERKRKDARLRGQCFYWTGQVNQFRNVETNEPYIYKKEEQAYCPVEIIDRIYEVKIPHHEGTTTKKEKYWKIIPNGEKLNADGTKWVP